MLQNRVDPYGNIIRTPARGAWMGNRGVLHNEHQQIVRPFKTKAWITCRLEFKGWKRQVMKPDRYTELFFLDEATAFAAGHRPCFECRREDAKRFKGMWIKGNPGYGIGERDSIQEIDDILHQERMSKNKVIEAADNIPNGTFVRLDGEAYLLFDKQLLLWTPFGYEQGRGLDERSELELLTPLSIVNAFRAGYVAEMRVG